MIQEKNNVVLEQNVYVLYKVSNCVMHPPSFLFNPYILKGFIGQDENKNWLNVGAFLMDEKSKTY